MKVNEYNLKQRKALRLVCGALDMTASDLAKELDVTISTATFALRLNDDSLPAQFVKFMHDLPAERYTKVHTFIENCRSIGDYLNSLRAV